MARLDERQVIEIFQQIFGNKKFVSEDVETFRIGKNFGVIKTDTLVASTDVPPKMKLADVARKSVVASVSDFAAKGVRPLYCIISVSLPKDFTGQKVAQLARGFRAAAKEFGFSILGGDTNRAKEMVISVTLVGMAGKITHRGSAGVGDVIFVTGPFGLSSAGLEILLNCKKAPQKFRKLAERSVFYPTPRLGFGISASGLLTAAMDSSDGLSTCLVEMARQSKKKFALTLAPGADGLEEFARKNRLDFLDLIFNGGEEYELVGTVPPRNFGKIEKIARQQGIRLIEIGRVKKGSGVVLQKAEIADRGWSHKF
ncbi:MAG: thiamine-phosphate kinase [Candidatus Nitrosotenuis sp.]